MIGDEFVSDTYTKYFKNAFGDEGQIGYIRAHYEVTAFCLGNEQLNRNVLSRYRNAVVNAINEQITLPKAIIFVMEQEFLETLKHFEPGISYLLGKSIEYIANQTHRILTAHKEKLPTRSRKFKYHTVLWAVMPEHYDWKHFNEFREKYTLLIKSTTSLFREMDVLNITWDDCDRGYFTRMKLNARGLSAYWIGVNEAFERWDKEQIRNAKGSSCGSNKFNMKKKKPNHFREDTGTSARFAWKPAQTRFKLPSYVNKLN